eukprot:TRINITY_DN2679_c0_g1_i1.p1 TRINITY_DN2679_c0_g1~~TRINITY_DN2679_c0_g1_i1.p1  ORF type:complete len:834 (-),score=180.01 TRINITY_DN2679_c0_g1_i1:105-2606(-)
MAMKGYVATKLSRERKESFPKSQPELKPLSLEKTKFATSTSAPKIFSAVSVKLSEAKGLRESESYCCVLSFGNTVYRTRNVIPRSPGEPFWGEDFEFFIEGKLEVPFVAVVWDNKAEAIGQVLLSSKAINLQKDIYGFHPLQPITSDAFVRGQIRVVIKYQPPDNSNHGKGSLFLRVIEAKDLGNKTLGGNTCDPYVLINAGEEKHKTKSQKKTLNPVWNQDFEFVLRDISVYKVVLTILDKDKRFPQKGSFLGNCEIVLLHLEPNQFHDLTLPLHGTDGTAELSSLSVNLNLHAQLQSALGGNSSNTGSNGNENKNLNVASPRTQRMDHGKKSIGDLRFSLQIEEVVVLPKEEYEPLLSYLLERPVEELESIFPVSENYAKSLLRVFAHKNQAMRLVKDATQRDIENTPNPEVIFRANTLGSKLAENYLKLYGYNYLKVVLAPAVGEVMSSKKSCEIDPAKVDKSEISANYQNLLYFLQKILNSIYSSAHLCPLPLREMFSFLRTTVRKREWGDPNIEYTVVSSFLFLRFFCAALLGPRLFSISDDHPMATAARSLTLLSKIVQCIANFQPKPKEEYMKDLSGRLLCEMDRMKVFLDFVSEIAEPPSIPPPVLSYSVSIPALPVSPASLQVLQSYAPSSVPSSLLSTSSNAILPPSPSPSSPLNLSSDGVPNVFVEKELAFLYRHLMSQRNSNESNVNGRLLIILQEIELKIQYQLGSSMSSPNSSAYSYCSSSSLLTSPTNGSRTALTAALPPTTPMLSQLLYNQKAALSAPVLSSYSGGGALNGSGSFIPSDSIFQAGSTLGAAGVGSGIIDDGDGNAVNLADGHNGEAE